MDPLGGKLEKRNISLTKLFERELRLLFFSVIIIRSCSVLPEVELR